MSTITPRRPAIGGVIPRVRDSAASHVCRYMCSVPPRKPAHRRDRRELEVLHRVAVALSQSLAFSDVMDALARELVHAVDRVSECSITVWHPARDVLEIASVYVRETGTSEEDRGDI